MAAGRCWFGRVCYSMGEAEGLKAEREQSIVGAGTGDAEAYQTGRQLSETTASGRWAAGGVVAGPQRVFVLGGLAAKAMTCGNSHSHLPEKSKKPSSPPFHRQQGLKPGLLQMGLASRWPPIHPACLLTLCVSCLALEETFPRLR